MTIDETIAKMTDIFTADRIRDPKVDGKWIIWTSPYSEKTLSKFVDRAKRAGIRSVWARSGKVGCAKDQ